MWDGEVVVRLNAVSPTDGSDYEVECLVYGASVRNRGSQPIIGEYSAMLHAYVLDRQEGLVAVVLPQSTFQHTATVLIRDIELVDGKGKGH